MPWRLYRFETSTQHVPGVRFTVLVAAETAHRALVTALVVTQAVAVHHFPPETARG